MNAADETRRAIERAKTGPDLDRSIADLAETVLRVKAERDYAVKLLREVLGYNTLGSDGPFKAKVRAWFDRIGERS